MSARSTTLAHTRGPSRSHTTYEGAVRAWAGNRTHINVIHPAYQLEVWNRLQTAADVPETDSPELHHQAFRALIQGSIATHARELNEPDDSHPPGQAALYPISRIFENLTPEELGRDALDFDDVDQILSEPIALEWGGQEILILGSSSETTSFGGRVKVSSRASHFGLNDAVLDAKATRGAEKYVLGRYAWDEDLDTFRSPGSLGIYMGRAYLARPATREEEAAFFERNLWSMGFPVPEGYYQTLEGMFSYLDHDTSHLSSVSQSSPEYRHFCHFLFKTDADFLAPYIGSSSYHQLEIDVRESGSRSGSPDWLFRNAHAFANNHLKHFPGTKRAPLHRIQGLEQVLIFLTSLADGILEDPLLFHSPIGTHYLENQATLVDLFERQRQDYLRAYNKENARQNKFRKGI